MKRDLLSVVEAAYQVAPTLDAWLANLVAVGGPLLDRGLGVFATVYHLGEHGEVDVHLPPLTHGNVAPRLIAVSPSLFGQLNGSAEGRRLIRLVYTRAPHAGTFSQLTRSALGLDQLDTVWKEVPSHPADAVALLGGDPSGHGVVLSASTATVGRMDARERLLWSRVAAHVASAYRLLRRDAANVDAVLHPDGRVAHAEPAAQTRTALITLREETRSMDRARGRLRRADPDEALAAWRGLVAGQWSLVDQIDADGRRYIFARRNAPEVHPWEDLTERERQVLAYAAEGQSHKAIGYELGIGVSTVGTHLKGAARKVGVRSRLALVRAWRARMAGPP